MEMTSSQIIGRLRAEGNGAVEELITLFRTADLVKFAKHNVKINENDQNLINALSFVNDTKREENAPRRVIKTENPAYVKENKKRIVLTILTSFVVVAALFTFIVAVYRMYIIL